MRAHFGHTAYRRSSLCGMHETTIKTIPCFPQDVTPVVMMQDMGTPCAASLSHTYSLSWSSRTLVFRVVGSCDHALALTSITSVIEAEPLPSSVFPHLHRYYGPLGLPPGSARFQPFALYARSLPDAGCRVGPLLFRHNLWKRAVAFTPGRSSTRSGSIRVLSVAFTMTVVVRLSHAPFG